MRLVTSAVGMFETCRRILKMSAFGGTPEVIGAFKMTPLTRPGQQGLRTIFLKTALSAAWMC
jgi:hypothetical protein